MKVLVAEDDRIARRLLVRHLERWGYEVVRAEHGREACDVFEADDEIGIAILDWMMPELDGVDVCRKLRAAEDRRPYILLCTARTEVSDIVTGLNAGADDYLAKPIRAAELEARLRVGARTVGLEHELKQRIGQLSAALEHVKQLQGMLPICMHCRRVRNSDDVWQQIETYVEQHADVSWSHGLCEDCLDEHYPPEQQGDAAPVKGGAASGRSR
jgi:DNA-binding response OmpR family regulator